MRSVNLSLAVEIALVAGSMLSVLAFKDLESWRSAVFVDTRRSITFLNLCSRKDTAPMIMTKIPANKVIMGNTSDALSSSLGLATITSIWGSSVYSVKFSFAVNRDK